MIQRPLTHLFSLSIETTSMPLKWKLANIHVIVYIHCQYIQCIYTCTCHIHVCIYVYVCHFPKRTHPKIDDPYQRCLSFQRFWNKSLSYLWRSFSLIAMAPDNLGSASFFNSACPYQSTQLHDHWARMWLNRWYHAYLHRSYIDAPLTLWVMYDKLLLFLSKGNFPAVMEKLPRMSIAASLLWRIYYKSSYSCQF